MTCPIRRLPLSGAWLLAIAATLAAQTHSGSVQGRLIDEYGSPIAGGTVTLQGSTAPQQTGADAQGHFRFLQVSPGTYSVTASAPGFATATREAVLVSVGRLTALEILLSVSNVSEELTVSGETPLIDPGRVATGQTFAREQLTEIPTARDVWSLVQQVPGLQLDTVNVAGNASATLGGPSLSNRGSGNVAYAIEGATITDSFYGFATDRQNGGTSIFFDYGTFEDVEVVTGGSSLDQQNSGVTINVVTKRGTNTLKGSARFLYASANWQSDNTPESSSAAGLQTNSTRFIREYGGELGGPLIEDRLWLWAAGARQDISLSPTTFDLTEVPVPQTVTLEPWSAKLTAQTSSPNSLTLFYQRSDRSEYGIGVASDRPPETRENLLVPSNFYKIEDSHVFSPDLFASVFGAYQEPEFNSVPVGGRERDMAYYDGQYHGSFFYKTGEQPQWQANLHVSKFFETGPAGHELKFGFNYRQQVIDSSSGVPGSQNFGEQFAIEDAKANLTRGVELSFRSEYWSATLGDTVSAGNFTLSGGLRFDLQRGRNLEARSLANEMFEHSRPGTGFPGLPEVRYPGADDWQIQFVDWQPRVSATYAIGRNKDTLLRATYARYADQLGWLTGFLGGAPSSNGYVYGWDDLNSDHVIQENEVDWDTGPTFFGAGIDPQTLPVPPNEVASDLRTPSTNEVTVGVDRELGKNFAVSGTFAYRNTTDLQYLLPIGANALTWELGGRATGTVELSDGSSLAFDEPYYLLTLEQYSGQLVLNRPGESQRYFGVDVSVVKRLSSNWMFRANVGWNSFRQHLEPESIQDPNNYWAAGGQNDDGGLATAVSPKANVWLNAAWQFNLNGLYQGPWGVTLGANLYGRQGYPKPFRVNVITDDPVTGDLGLLIDQVDTYRYPNVYQLDLRLQKTLEIGPVTVTPAIELFNVANSNTLLNSEPVAGRYVLDWYRPKAEGIFEPDPFFDDTVEIQSPRIVRLGIQVSF